MTPAEEAALRDDARRDPSLAPHVAALLRAARMAQAIADVLARKADLGRRVAEGR